MRLLCLAVLSACCANALPTGSGSAARPPTATIKNGTVSGLHSSTYNQDMFLGVPFAQPPVGELRFRNPKSIKNAFRGTLHATEYAPECVGYGGDQIGYPISEDCLYLNVVRPSGYDHEALPVGVWIHGGGFVPAYRLSAWGFLQSQEVTGSGNTNMGLRDQRLALHWLQENIAAFGGDPTKVTIWGEVRGAGAASVGWHIVAYNGRDDHLFRAGIMESGNPVTYTTYRTNTEYQPLYNGVVKAAGCKDAIDNLECLRKVPFAKLNDILNTTDATHWQPIVDGDFIARWASIQIAEGDFVKVPIIDGANTDEGTAFGPQGVNNTKDFVEFATSKDEGAYIGKQFAPGLLEAYPNIPSYWIPPVAEIGMVTYPAPYGDEYRRSAAYFGDVVMIANRRGACEAWADNNIPAYCYRFNTIPAGVPWEAGVTHFQEVAFVFDNTNGLGYNAEHDTINPFRGKPDSYFELAKLMSCSWASFIYDLNPNDFDGRYASADAWPVYSIENPQNIVWDANKTSLAYAEPDTWRKEGIRWILDHAKDYHR